MTKRRDKMIHDAREEAQRILRDAKDTADQTIRQINKLASESGVGKELEAERARIRGKLKGSGFLTVLKEPGKRAAKSPSIRKS